MSRWLYGLWALAVVSALVLPVALPYAIWSGEHDRAVAMCAQRAEDDVVRETYFRGLPLALDVRVERCSGATHDVLRYDADVTVRGAYGIPIASGHTTASGEIQSLEAGDGLVLSLVALMAGVVVVSIPFAFVSTRQLVQRRFGHAA